MKTSIIAMMACAVLVGVAVAGEHPKETAAGAGGGALDGKVFAAQLVKSGEKDGDKDQLTFKRGQIPVIRVRPVWLPRSAVHRHREGRRHHLRRDPDQRQGRDDVVDGDNQEGRCRGHGRLQGGVGRDDVFLQRHDGSRASTLQVATEEIRTPRASQVVQSHVDGPAITLACRQRNDPSPRLGGHARVGVHAMRTSPLPFAARGRADATLLGSRLIAASSVAGPWRFWACASASASPPFASASPRERLGSAQFEARSGCGRREAGAGSPTLDGRPTIGSTIGRRWGWERGAS